MAADGQSFFAASWGYGSWPNGAYYYPEASPNVTSVGGTSLTTNGSGGTWESETAWSDSGGGVSPDDFTIVIGPAIGNAPARLRRGAKEI